VVRRALRGFFARRRVACERINSRGDGIVLHPSFEIVFVSAATIMPRCGCKKIPRELYCRFGSLLRLPYWQV